VLRSRDLSKCRLRAISAFSPNPNTTCPQTSLRYADCCGRKALKSRAAQHWRRRHAHA
jgi:hypothetical protein